MLYWICRQTFANKEILIKYMNEDHCLDKNKTSLVKISLLIQFFDQREQVLVSIVV